MVLSTQFIMRIGDCVNQFVEHNIQRMNVENEEDAKKVWGYEHSFDYHYGRSVGMLIRILREEFRIIHGREAEPNETIEILTHLQQNTWKIKQGLALFKK